MRCSESGFSLIELMIVVAIIGILSIVAVPIYQSYVIETQLNRAVTELSAYKSGFEVQALRSGSVSNTELGYVSSDLVSSPGGVGQLNPDSSGHLQVTMGGNAHPNLSGVILKFERSSAGEWRCVIDKSAASNWVESYTPSGCTVL